MDKRMPGRAIHTSRKYRSPVIWALGVVLLFAVSACRDKENTITGPGPGPGNGWTLTLEDKPVLYSPPNDTIDVRLIDPNGNRALGKTVTFRAEFDSAQVTRFAQTTSTSWGSNPPLVYWGNGSNDQDNPVEIIHAYYIDVATHDTLAQTSRMYAVTPP